MHRSVMAGHSSRLVAAFVLDDSAVVCVLDDETACPSTLRSLLIELSIALATILYRFDSSLDCTMPKMVRRLASRWLRPVALRKNSFPVEMWKAWQQKQLGHQA